MALHIDTKYAKSYIKTQELEAITARVENAHRQLHEKTGPGSDFTGWLTLPADYDKHEFERIRQAAKKIQATSDILVVIGIGGSYLGARAAIELLRSPNYNLTATDTPQIFFAGNSISSESLGEILDFCKSKDFSINIISKSGTTTEPAIAFRMLKNLLVQRYGQEGAKKRIYATTDQEKGTLKALADRDGYTSFVVPDNIGGRYSVLTAVGLLPMAVAGLDIDMAMAGAQEAMNSLSTANLLYNDAYLYAAIRNILYQQGKTLELMVSFEPGFTMMNEWFKQLFGESEGKDGKGIFPASAIYSTDLHSLGQYLQDGTRNLFETVIRVEKPRREVTILPDADGVDGLDFLTGQPLSMVNQRAFEGTMLAHADGGVPIIILTMPEINEYEFGYMVYFFEKACAVSGYLLGVNPFDQPGVEDYKNNMFALLGKPGYEKQRAELQNRLKQ